MGSKQHLPPSILVQQQVRENATEIQNFLSDISNWSKEMRAKELASSNETIPTPVECVPLRNDPKKVTGVAGELPPQELPKSKISSGTDYSGWEKFDAEKACEDLAAAESEAAAAEEERKKPRLATDEDVVRRRAIELRLQKMAADQKELGNQCLKDKLYEKAIEYYTEGIRCDKKSAVLYANRAQAHIFLKQYDKAIEDCNGSIAIDPTYIKAYFRRAKARFNIGKLVDAKNDLKRTLDMEPGNVEAKHLLNEISRKTMQSLLSPSNKSVSAPSTPSSNSDRVPHFPGVMTRLGSSNHLHGGLPPSFIRPAMPSMDYDEDEEFVDLGGSGDNELYPKPIIPIIKPPARRSKRPLLPVFVKVVGNRGGGNNGEDGEEKKMRLMNLDCNGNNEGFYPTPSTPSSSSSSVPSTPTSVTSTPSTQQLPCLFSQLQMTSLPPKPSTAAQFGLDWRKIKGNSDLAAQYLNQLSREDYGIFGESLEYGRLSEILELLVWEFLPRGWNVLPQLEGLSSVKRFSTLALFMSEKDRANARKLISEVHPSLQSELSLKYSLV